MTAGEPSAYLPISAYGAIGNLRTVALVGRNGSIDWCCLPELSRPSVFAALLDHRRGGSFRVSPVGRCRAEQRYRGDTCVLETHFETDGGVVVMTDFMPLRGSIIGASDPDTAPEIYRLLECQGGDVEMEVAWSPRFDFARAGTRIERIEGGFRARAGGERLVLAGAPDDAQIVDAGEGPAVRGRFRVRAGERRVLATRFAADDVEHASQEASPHVALDEAWSLLHETCATWSNWAHDNEERPTQDWAGEWSNLVTRSELVLKLLTHPDSGAIAAAPTTSLPEGLGGVRNWDYRFCWVRDASFVVQALHSLGHSAEAQAFINFVERAVREGDGEHQQGRLQIMYGLHGETDLEEHVLDHLEGYRSSRPVRIGNAAAGQRQHDILGEMLDALYELVRRGHELEPDDWRFMRRIADQACASWREPDSGIWEMRGPEKHFVHSKVMAWVALDRAVRLAEDWGLEGDAPAWRASRKQIHDLIMRHGYNEEVGAFTQSFGSDALDASILRLPVQEFIDATDPRMQSTLDHILERLTVNGLVYRYRVDDGLPGEEGAFGLCTFWLVDALTLAGRVDEAHDIFERMMARANGVGLFSEQIDPHSGQFLGNFPQAFSHLGVINSALYLARAEGRPIPEHARLVGTRESDSEDAAEHGGGQL